jgi:uncharacterized protein (TIRG00374 family)
LVLGQARRQRAIPAVVLLLALLGVLLALLDWREVQRVAAEASWQWAPLTLVFTAVSYIFLSFSYALINRAFGIRLGRRELFAVGFVSSAMIAAVGGLAGHSLRVLLMVRRGQAAGDVMAPSLFHSYLESLVFFALIPAGLVYLLLTQPLSHNVALGVGVGTALLGVAFALTAVVFFWGPVRRVALRLVRTVWRLAARRDIGPSLGDFEATLRRGLGEVRNRPGLLALPVGLVLADRLARVAVVWLCFQALGSDVGPAVAMTGFAIGVALGVMSLVPGGLGVQEGSMVGVFHLLGVPLEEAVLASLLFRVAYSSVPFGLSLVFYRGILRVGRA